MEKNNLGELLSRLNFIGMYKWMLPLHLRGWVNSLGLYVQRKGSVGGAGSLRRLQGGGKFRGYLDVWSDEEGNEQIGKFDRQVWESRFAHLVEPTLEIANFLVDRVTYHGDLDPAGENTLNHAIQRYKSTGQWLGLPRVPDDVKFKHEGEYARARQQEISENRIGEISFFEKRVRADPLDRLAWVSLPHLNCEEEKFKDMENALKMQLQVAPHLRAFEELGKTYLAALSNSILGKGIIIWGTVPSNVGAAELGYGIEELRALAEQNLCKAYELSEGAGYYGDEHFQEIILARKCVEEFSVEAFEEFDRFERRARLGIIE
ncbi:MAG: hypothetical protein O2783_05185 [Chloroflexi bacterium]|nr:hypothetical protein [Chloroflexota bacterium]